MTAEDRFKALVAEDLQAENAASGAFAQAYDQRKKAWLDAQKAANYDNPNKPSEAALTQHFNNEIWIKQLAPQLQESAEAAYADRTPKEGQGTNDIAAQAGGILNKAAEGGIASLMTGGDMMGGATHALRHAGFGLLTGLPGVGNFLSQLGRYIGGLLGSWFGDQPALSWKEAGEQVKQEKINERLAGLAPVADVKQLQAMAAEAAKEPETSTAAASSGAASGQVAASEPAQQETGEQPAAGQIAQPNPADLHWVKIPFSPVYLPVDPNFTLPNGVLPEGGSVSPAPRATTGTSPDTP